MSIPANRTLTGQFAKGVSGNPSGRKPEPQAFKELAVNNCVELLQIVIDIAKDPNASNKDRLRAVDMVLDRGLGKAVQQMDINGNAEYVIKVPRLDKIIEGENEPNI